MERLVGRRFGSLDEIRNEIEKITHKKIGTIFESESDRLEECDFMIDYDGRGLLRNAIFKITDLLKVRGLKTQSKYKKQVEEAINKKEAEIEDITKSLRKAEKELKNLKRKEKDIEGERSAKDAEDSPADVFSGPKAFENPAMDTAIYKTTV